LAGAIAMKRLMMKGLGMVVLMPDVVE